MPSKRHAALLLPLLSLACVGTKAPSALPFDPGVPASQCTVTLREANEAYLTSFDGKSIDLHNPRSGYHAFFFPGDPVKYSQYKVPPGHHVIAVRLQESHDNSFHGAQHSDDYYLVVDLLDNHAYHVESNTDFGIRLGGTIDPDHWHPALVDDATQKSVSTRPSATTR